MNSLTRSAPLALSLAALAPILAPAPGDPGRWRLHGHSFDQPGRPTKTPGERNSPTMMSGSITVLDASDNSSLAVLEAALGGIMLDWGRVTKPLPPAALGRPVRFEFRFPSDNMAEFAGWYIDAIELTVPKPRPPPQNKDQAFTPVSCLHRTVDRLWLASVGVRGSGNRLLKFADSTNQ